MGRYIGPVCKLCRREGDKLFLKGERCYNKCPVDKPTGILPPGQHGKKRMKTTEYGKRLREKQKTKRIAGLLERQFYGYFDKARHLPGQTGENLLRLLEIRLDNVVRRLGFAPSMSLARQLVSHGHILVNGKRVNVPSFLVKVGDTISLSDKLKGNLRLQRSIANQVRRSIPTWLELDESVAGPLGRAKDLPVDLKETKVQGRIRLEPPRDEFSYKVNDQYIVELYSK
ncbi:30S ribosomal protein S4 [bacterium F11]|nr:30S ribosomal protein S4 [bacterium F11]